MAIDRIRVPWTGGRGGAGVSTFYALDATTAVDPLHDFFDALKALVPASITWSFAGSGDTIDETDGTLTGSWAGTGQANVVATGSDTNVADPVGAVINWETTQIRYGHRVKGRTFIVPGIKDMYASGTLNDSVVTQLEGYADALIDAVPNNLVVWTRPFAGTPQWTDVHGRVHPARTAHDGATSSIVTVNVPDKVVVLRSRRD